MERQKKLKYIISYIKSRIDSEIIASNSITLGSDEITSDSISPKDVLQTLRLLKSQPNCIDFEYENRYKNEDAIYSDGQLHDELQEFRVVVSDVPGAYEQSIQNLLSVLDFSIKILSDFDSGVQNVLSGKTIGCPKNKTDVALELCLEDEQLFVLQVRTNKYHRIKALNKSNAYCPIIEYAMKHQDVAFNHREVYQNNYDTYDLLGRIFGNIHIYKPFFTILGKDMLIAHFSPTYADIESMGEDFQTIIDALEDLKTS